MLKQLKYFVIISLTGIFTFIITSCDPSKKYEKDEQEKIDNYLASSNLQFSHKSSGLYYYEISPGTGEVPNLYDTIEVKYTGKLLDGTVFDETKDNETFKFIFYVDPIIEGFNEGVSYMKEGGKSYFLIPSTIGYGNYGYLFPAYTPTLFEVELIRIGRISK